MEWQKDPAAPGKTLHKVEIERKRWGEGEREGEREGVRERGREYVVNHLYITAVF